MLASTSSVTPPEGEAPVQRVTQARGHHLGLLAFLHARQEHRELVAGEAGQRVRLARRLDEPRGDLAQQLVAVAVAEGVVDLLEPVEVDQHHGDVLVAACGAGERVLDPVVEQEPVRQAGQPSCVA